jgi:GTPase
VIDVQEDPASRFASIDAELRAYGAGLAERPQIVVLNKIDLVPEPPEVEFNDPRVLGVLPVSAVTGAGVEELRRSLFELIADTQAAAEPEPAELADFLVYRPPPPRRRPYRIFRGDRGFRVSGVELPDDELRAALQAAGARPGDEVDVGDSTFVFE